MALNESMRSESFKMFQSGSDCDACIVGMFPNE